MKGNEGIIKVRGGRQFALVTRTNNQGYSRSHITMTIKIEKQRVTMTVEKTKTKTNTATKRNIAGLNLQCHWTTWGGQRKGSRRQYVTKNKMMQKKEE